MRWSSSFRACLKSVRAFVLWGGCKSSRYAPRAHVCQYAKVLCDAGRAASGDERILFGLRTPEVSLRYNCVGAAMTGSTGPPLERASSVRAQWWQYVIVTCWVPPASAGTVTVFWVGC